MPKINREFFTIDGNPEDSAERQAVEENARFHIIEQGERPKELEQFLEKVDFKTLRLIFEDIAAKCGVDKEKLNFISPERIGARFLHAGYLGRYLLTQNLISFDIGKIEQNAQTEQMPIRPETHAHAVLAHEECHAISRTFCSKPGLGRALAPGEQAVEKSGFGQSKDTKSPSGGYEYDDRYRLFNEGMTESLARIVTQEYFEKTGYDPAESMKFREMCTGPDSGKLMYPLEEALLQWMVVHISEATTIPQSDVWNGFVRSYLEGEDFEDPNIRQSFVEIFSEDFLDKLAKMQSQEDVAALLNDLQLKWDKNFEKTESGQTNLAA